MKKIIRILMLVVMLILIVGCTKHQTEEQTNQAEVSEDKKDIKIGCMPLNQEAVSALKEMVKNKGYTLEVMVFDGNNLPAEALKAGEIDGLILNHLPWINTFNEQNDANLVKVDGFAYASQFGLYSDKHKTVEEIPEKGKIIVSNDPSNMDRSLRMLEKEGLITLGEKTGEFYSILDIKENKKNLEILEVETTSTAGSYKDVDASIAFTSVMKNAGIDPQSYIIEDGESGNYPTGLVVQSGNENSEWAKAIVEEAKTDEYKQKFDEIYQGAYVIIER